MKKDSKLGVYVVAALLTVAGVYVGRSMANAGSAADASRSSVRFSIPDRPRPMNLPDPGRSAREPAAQRKSLLRSNVNIIDNRPATGTATAAEATREEHTVVREETAEAPARRTARRAAHPSAMRMHEIQPGERLWDIARKYYGSGAKWTKIRDANPGVNPENLKLGAKLLIP